MDHRLVHGIEHAFGWAGPDRLGREFARGTLPDPELCARLLTPARLLDLISRRELHNPQLRMLRNGADLHPREYLAQHPSSRGHRISMAAMPRIGHYLEQGATLVLDDLAPLDATLEVACRALSWWSGEHTRVNMYLTTQEASGWGIHWDSHDVLVVQLDGTKSWEVRGPTRPAPMERDAEPNLEPSGEIVWSGTLRTGDVMHIPRGWWHQATRTGRGNGHSLHATFGLTQRTGVDYLAWIADQARATGELRVDLGQRPDTDQHQRLAAVAADLLHRRSPADFLATRHREDTRTRHTTAFGIFGPPRAVVCVTNFPPELTVDDDIVTVQAAGKKITVPAVALPALRPLLSGNPADLADLASHTGVDTAALAAAFTGAGVCADLTADLATGYDGTTTTSQPATAVNA
ncbi:MULTISPECIES: JmjC domain-containing protein [Actinoalloteichus]|uniref:Cupin superfamily protein n=1 Tax=Actinoalloteichus fjordicus TaxID=1612552 RepID=A0AAC9PQW1_9PSEU|nr:MULTISPECIES: cupin domain-containing protein [Actinoalloteichus]APU13191.1 Cupin superfamily protein [Actinoalloteichus fjordicus]APU19142.1 Cupin superfamily protein [Actinoalloteichus sp. GBA129-24]